MPNVGKNFADRVNGKMARVFQRLADPCQFTPVDGTAPFVRLVSLDDNRTDLSSITEYIPDIVTRAEFLLSEGAVNVDDTFALGSIDDSGAFIPNGQQGRLTQRVSMDSVCVAFIYITIED
ncbi:MULTISPECIES: hypothetical protein [unclassified Shewanella]|uniref:hypothetical protein n=1 Tax=unclassified Shewanella TaxID=196818 RepID=UPI0021DA9096|nr:MULTISPECIES: hypothetical protein [unclassified Shewanella]MCU8034373.1 hypothetical protein [Shewanella sp. SM71]MCU8096080.1 hypothetical protein [Shewanella sp. SM102]